MEAEDPLDACVGGGNLTFTSLTNPPVTKTYFTARLDSAFGPPRPPKPAVYNFLTPAAKGKIDWEGWGDPEGRNRKQQDAGFFFF